MKLNRPAVSVIVKFAGRISIDFPSYIGFAYHAENTNYAGSL
jgi:hypothetical protein